MKYNLDGKVAIVIGGGGAICGEIALALAREGVAVAIWDLSSDSAEKRCKQIHAEGGNACAIECNAGDPTAVNAAVDETLQMFGKINILINGAGGSRKEATTSPELEFFDITPKALLDTLSLNYMTAVIPSQAVGRIFAKNRSGVIVNISSVSSFLPLTRAIAYSNAKAALNSFTRWLAVHMARNYAPEIRVNAIAPGFILTEQNRFLLVDEHTGEMTERGRQVLAHVPMARYGRPEEIAGAALWLVSDAASFVTGSIVTVDGGFSAYFGV